MVKKQPYRFYYGHFRWDGKVYPGIHEPLISRELFDATQAAFTRHNKPKKRQHDFAYAGLVTCGHCGCALTPEQHVKKSGKRYVYYRCTAFKGKCPEPYMREEVLADKFADVVKAIHLHDETLTWVVTALKDSQKDEAAFHLQVYMQQTHEERARLLQFLLLNSTLKDGSLCITYRKPFDIIAE